jgi:ABC-type nitrate/sulfonate/bicarbonate transport system substrate-binding protein
MNIHAYAAGALLALACASGPAWADDAITVNGFGGAADLPVWVAQQKGFFAKEGLHVDYQQTRGSVAQFQDIMAGKFQIAATLLDNVVGYAEGQGEVQLKPASDVFAFMGSHEGVNSLVTSATVHSYADIKGRKVAVDAVSTGYAFVLFAMLEKNGLMLDRDYQAVAVGGPPGRFAALKDGRAAAALMAPPADLAAKTQGYNLLTDTVTELGPYQAGVYAARRAWANAHPQQMERFTRAMIAAHDYIFNNKAGAVEVLRAHFPDMSAQTAEAIYATSVKPGGFQRGALISVNGALTALDLRSRYSPAKVKLTDPGKYIDLSYYQRALRQ